MHKKKRKDRLLETSHRQSPSDVSKRIRDWTDTMSRQAKKHPGRTVALALGAGYLVGGGLASRLTARIIGAGVRIGLRMISLPVVSRGMVALGQGQWSRAGSDR